MSLTTINQSALLPYSASQLFDLVNDIESYPEFMDGCLEAEILSKKEMTVSKIQSIVYQLIGIFKVIHNNGVIHRDVKPQNIMVKNGELFLIDFGFSTFYIDGDGEHCQNACSECIIGSPKYVSYYIHSGSIASRRDDLISLGYVYMYLCNRTLPWDTLMEPDSSYSEYEDTHILNHKNKQRMLLKQFDHIQPICFVINNQIENFMNYCYHIQYDDTPNYDALIDIFTHNN